MKQLLFLCIAVLVGGCSLFGGQDSEALTGLLKNCAGPAEVRVHAGSWNRYIEVTCEVVVEEDDE